MNGKYIAEHEWKCLILRNVQGPNVETDIEFVASIQDDF